MRVQRRCKTLTIQESFGTLGLKVTRDLDEIWLHTKSACVFNKGGNERAVPNPRERTLTRKTQWLTRVEDGSH
jgi:hypothetical protein